MLISAEILYGLQVACKYLSSLLVYHIIESVFFATRQVVC